MRRHVCLPLLVASGLLLAGCGSSSSSSSAAGSSSSTAAATCRPASLQTKTAGHLTIGADQPVYEPWFTGNDPGNGKGFEGAVDAAIAKQLGYAPSQVSIARVAFDIAIQRPQTFDFDLDEYSITAARQKRVDFSAPYYDVTQAVVTVKGSKAAGVTTLAGLKSLKLGAQVGTTSYTDAMTAVDPSQSIGVYNSNSDALQALRNGQIDALVTDLPTAFYMTSAQLKGGLIVGQLPSSGGTPEQFGALLAKGSPLTSCVSAAVNTLRSNGTLAALQQKWLASQGNAPVLH